MKTILIIITGPTNKYIKNIVGDKIKWYSRVISREEIGIKIKLVYLGEKLHPDEGDAWIITGSEFSVSDKYPWLIKTIVSLNEAILIGKPILGICFGHQLIAKTLGGKVGKNPKGWEVGVCPIELNSSGKKAAIFSNFPTRFNAAETHQDTILKLPKGCISLATNNMGYQAFEFNDNVVGVQFHPEFTQKIMNQYIKIRLKANIPIINPNIPDLSFNEKIFDNFINYYTLGD